MSCRIYYAFYEVVLKMEQFPKVDELEKLLKEQSRIVKYAICLHDQSVDEYGRPLRPHYHVILRFKSMVDPLSVEELFDMLPIWYQGFRRSWDDALLYLVHYGSRKKNQYPIGSVRASFDYAEAIANIRKKRGMK